MGQMKKQQKERYGEFEQAGILLDGGTRMRISIHFIC